MQIEPRHSQSLPAEWTGARLVVEKWLRQLCATEAIFQLGSGAVMLLAGVVVLVLTSCFAAMVFFMVLFRTGRLFGASSLEMSGTQEICFTVLFLLFMSFSIFHAWRTRWKEEAATRIQFGSSFTNATDLILEIISAGPIFIVLAIQDFQKYARLSRLDVPQVAALVFWLFEKGGRASFAEISLNFSGLNIVRVLPQLRDLPGIHWWPDKGSLSLLESLKYTLAQLLHRDPEKPFASTHSNPNPPHSNQPAPGVSDEMLSWYTTLNLPPFATLPQVKARYRKLAKIHHPDARARNYPTGEPADDGQMKRINEAYHNILKHSQNQAGSFS